MRRKGFYKAEKLRDIKALLQRAVNLYADRIAYKEIGPNKEIHDYTYKRLSEDVNGLGTKLLDMGLKGKHISILGENSYLWVVSYLASINGVGVVVPLDKELLDSDIINLFIQGDVEVLITTDTFAHLTKDIQVKCPKLKTCIITNPSQEYEGCIAIEKVIAEGKRILELGNREYIDTEINIEEMCEIVFTSGTTGANKGVMLSQKNLMAAVYGAMQVIKAVGISFSVLPINHTYECTCHILGGIYSGITVCFNDNLKRVIENINLFQPNMSIMVPLFLESIYKNIWRESKKHGLDKHLRYGIKFSNLIRKIGIDQRRYFFKPVLEKFGGNLNQIVCGGAPLRTEIVKGLGELGIEVLNGFGITECAPLISSNMETWNKPGSVGRIIPNCTVRIDNPNEHGFGEIQVKGDNVMLGYYNDPENTKATFSDDGWFKTGDLGTLDKDNFLYINGREKNLIVLSNGKNVCPEELEDIIIGTIDYVKEVVVYSTPNIVGDDTINARVYFEEEFLLEKGLIHCKEKFELDLKRVNGNLPSYKRITSISVSESEFIKTTTKKIKRHLVLKEEVVNV